MDISFALLFIFPTTLLPELLQTPTVPHFTLAQGTFLSRRKPGGACTAVPVLSRFSPREAALELDYLSLFSAQHKQTQSAP
jgi:hypothetical protein